MPHHKHHRDHRAIWGVILICLIYIVFIWWLVSFLKPRRHVERPQAQIIAVEPERTEVPAAPPALAPSPENETVNAAPEPEPEPAPEIEVAPEPDAAPIEEIPAPVEQPAPPSDDQSLDLRGSIDLPEEAPHADSPDREPSADMLGNGHVRQHRHRPHHRLGHHLRRHHHQMAPVDDPNFPKWMKPGTFD